MKYYVYGFKFQNSEYAVFECDSDDPLFKTGKVASRVPTFDRSEDIAKARADQEGTVAFPYKFHSWLYYRAMAVTGSLWLLRKPGMVSPMVSPMVEVTSSVTQETLAVGFPSIEKAELAMELISKLFNSRMHPAEQQKVEWVDNPEIELVDRNTLCGVPTIGGILSDYGVRVLTGYGFKDEWLLPVSERLAEAYEDTNSPKFAVVNLRGTEWEHLLPDGIDGACVTKEEFLAMGLPEAPNWIPDGAGIHVKD